jgi:hypothetical protein
LPDPGTGRNDPGRIDGVFLRQEQGFAESYISGAADLPHVLEFVDHLSLPVVEGEEQAIAVVRVVRILVELAVYEEARAGLEELRGFVDAEEMEAGE